MPRTREGSVRTRPDGIYARVVWIDENGRRRDKTRKVENRTQAKRVIKDMLREIDEQGEQVLDSQRMTFRHLADFYEERYVSEAEYRGERKVSGLRDHKNTKSRLEVLRSYFGKKKLREIRYGDIEKFRASRLSEKTWREEERSIADVNRSLALLRHVLNVAFREGFLVKNPFMAGKPLIDSAAERKRDRILTRDEETKLLGLCVGPKAHLKPILIAALDTGMRRGEIFSLTWTDVDLPKRRITVRALNSKTLRARQVPITDRLAIELETLALKSLGIPSARVFGIEDNVNRSWTDIRTKTGLSDVRFHDLRHTAATRLVQMGLPLAEVARILGHSTPTMSYRYVNANADTLERAAQLLNSFSSMASSNTVPAEGGQSAEVKAK